MTANKKPIKKAPVKKAAAKKKPDAAKVEETVVVPLVKQEPAVVIYAGDVKNPKTKRRFLNWFKF
jgi:hypothetical protein